MDAPLALELPEAAATTLSRKEKRKGRKKAKRSEKRQQAAEQARQEEERALEGDPTVLVEDAEALEREKLEHDRQLRLWLEREKEAQEAADRKRREIAEAIENDENSWDYVEEGPAEIIWEGNEIIVRKQKVKVPKAHRRQVEATEDDHPVSNPLLPESLYQSSTSKPLPSQNAAYEDHKKLNNNERNPNFGTEQDKTHCPFHIKTGVCRFGVNCSRAHVYPDKSSTLLIKNMYNGPGLPLEHDEGLEYTDEEVLQNYEEFFEDVHGEFAKYGEIVNFKVCRNESSHLRGNVYVQFESDDSALTAYSAFNGRFYASKQITCEFVVVTRWRAALCGEYMRSHHKVCSHGTACNFLHCFKNPCGLYDWADWDNPPPRSFSAKHHRHRSDSKEDKSNHNHHRQSRRNHREDTSSTSRKSRQRDANLSRKRRYDGCRSNDDNPCEESLCLDGDNSRNERRHKSAKKRYKGRHNSMEFSEQSLSVDTDTSKERRHHKSSDKRDEGRRTRRKEDSRKQRYRSRSSDRHERKRSTGSRVRGIVDRRDSGRRKRRSSSHESSQSDGETSGKEREGRRERSDSHDRYRWRSRSVSPDMAVPSPQDESISRSQSRSSRDRRKRRHS